MSDAERFVELACLTYEGDSRARRDEAVAMLAADPTLVAASARAAAAAGDVDALRAHAASDDALVALCYSRIPQRDAFACLELLLAGGADPNAFTTITECRFTALTGLVGEGEGGPLEQPPHPDARRMVERLLDAGASPNDSQALYNTHFRPSDDWLELLLARGLSSTSDLVFLLGQAAEQGFTARVQRLLAAGTPADGRHHYNKRSHIENALLQGHADIARLLVAAGARWPTFSDHEKFRIAILANDATEALRILATAQTANEDPGALHAAARHDKLDALRLGLTLGLPIDGVDRSGMTALHHAVHGGHLAIVQELVGQGASLEVRDRNYNGTPLGHARHMAEHWPGPQYAEILAFLTERAS